MAGNMAEYLDSKWAVEIICEIDDEEGLRFGELEQEFKHISSSTLTTRLQDGMEVDLIEQGSRETSSGDAKIYTLTNKGTHLRYMMESFNIVTIYDYMKIFFEDFHQKRDELVEWVERSEDRFDNSEQNKQFTMLRRAGVSFQEVRELVENTENEE